jgi:hypothetical protein
MYEKKEVAKIVDKDYKSQLKGQNENRPKVFKDKLLNILDHYIQNIEIGHSNDNIRRTGLIKKKPYVDPFKEELK